MFLVRKILRTLKFKIFFYFIKVSNFIEPKLMYLSKTINKEHSLNVLCFEKLDGFSKMKM